MVGCLFLWAVFTLITSNCWGVFFLGEIDLQERFSASQNKISNLLPTSFFPKDGISKIAQKKPLQRQGTPARPRHLALSSGGEFLLCSWALENYPFLSYSQKLWQERAYNVSLQMRFSPQNNILFKRMEFIQNLQELHLFNIWPDTRPLKNLRKLSIKKLSISYSAVENRVFPIEDCRNFPPSLVSFSWQLPVFETDHQLSHYLLSILKQCRSLNHLIFQVGFLSPSVDPSIFRFSKVKKIDLIFSQSDHFSTFGLEDLFEDGPFEKDSFFSQQTSLSLSLPAFEKTSQLSNFFLMLFTQYPNLNFLTLKAPFDFPPFKPDFFRSFKIKNIKVNFE